MQDTDIPVRGGQNGGTMRHFSQHHRISLPPPPPYTLYTLYCTVKLRSGYCNIVIQTTDNLRKKVHSFLIRIRIVRDLLNADPDPGGEKNTEIKPAPEVRTVLGEQKYLGILKKLLKNCV